MGYFSGGFEIFVG